MVNLSSQTQMICCKSPCALVRVRVRVRVTVTVPSFASLPRFCWSQYFAILYPEDPSVCRPPCVCHPPCVSSTFCPQTTYPLPLPPHPLLLLLHTGTRRSNKDTSYQWQNELQEASCSQIFYPNGRRAGPKSVPKRKLVLVLERERLGHWLRSLGKQATALVLVRVGECQPTTIWFLVGGLGRRGW
jgi:hypothetical protein